MKLGASIKKSVVFAAALTLLFFTVGCQFPAFTLYFPDDPENSLTELIDAINRSDDSSVNDLLYNSSISFRTDSEMSDSEKAIADVLAKSRSFQVKNKIFSSDGSRRVRLTIDLTTFDMNLFEKGLTQAVENAVKQLMYEGEEITDTDAIISQQKTILLETPTLFYSTNEYTIEMILSKGKWRVDLTDEFYNALLGIH